MGKTHFCFSKLYMKLYKYQIQVKTKTISAIFSTNLFVNYPSNYTKMFVRDIIIMIIKLAKIYYFFMFIFLFIYLFLYLFIYLLLYLFLYWFVYLNFICFTLESMQIYLTKYEKMDLCISLDYLFFIEEVCDYILLIIIFIYI